MNAHARSRAGIASGQLFGAGSAARTGDYSDEGSALPGDAKLLIVGKSDLQNRLKLLLFNEFFF